MGALLTALTTGGLGRTRRPRESKKLVIRSSMASHRHCLCLHLHFARLDHHDGAGFGDHRPRSQDTPCLCAVAHPIRLCPRICFRAVSCWAFVRDLWPPSYPAALQPGIPGLQHGLWFCEDGPTVDSVSLFRRIWREVRTCIQLSGQTHTLIGLIMRFSAATAIGGGVLGDVWRPEERGLSVSIYTLITLLSPTIGPLLGGFITQYSSWRWAFWAISILDGCIQLIATLFFRETFAPVLLGRKAERLRSETGNCELRTKWERSDRTFTKIAKAGLARPFVLLATQPILQCLALYIAYTFGLVYLALTTFPALWTEHYHESISISGLNYLALAFGYIIGTQTCTRLLDRVYKHLKETRGKGIGQPEYRLPLLLPGALMIPSGLVWYGWSAQKHLHWIMPDIGAAIFAVGVKFSLQCTQLYALDVYSTYAASASAGSLFLRSLAGFSFPLFAPYLYQRLGLGWGNSLLALIALVTGLPIPFLLWFYGPSLRKRSTYAAGE